MTMTTVYVVAALAFVLFALFAHRVMSRSRIVTYHDAKGVHTHRTYAPAKCSLCWGSRVLEWLYEPPNGRGLHACTRCKGSGLAPGGILNRQLRG